MSGKKRVTYILLSILAGLMLFLIFRPFAFAIAMAALVTGALVSLVLLIKWSRFRFRKFRMRNTIEGIIESKTEIVNKRIASINEQITVIDRELSELELQSSNADIQEEVDRLKWEFKAEKELLLSKMAFYNVSKARYSQMLNDRQHLKTIKEKQRQLDQKRGLEDHSDEDDDSLELDKSTIDELDFLELKVEEAIDVKSAEAIIARAKEI